MLAFPPSTRSTHQAEGSTPLTLVFIFIITSYYSFPVQLLFLSGSTPNCEHNSPVATLPQTMSAVEGSVPTSGGPEVRPDGPLSKVQP